MKPRSDDDHDELFAGLLVSASSLAERPKSESALPARPSFQSQLSLAAGAEPLERHTNLALSCSLNSIVDTNADETAEITLSRSLADTISTLSGRTSLAAAA